MPIKRSDMTPEQLAAARAQDAAYRAANREKFRKANDKWAQANRGQIAQKGREYRRDNPNKVRDLALRYYGITAEQFDALYAAQGGRCAICTKEIPALGSGRHLDHCHNTNKIRGILCMLCNFGLGKFKDNPEALRAAAVYLETADTGYVVARPDRLNRPANKKRKKPVAL